MSQKMPNRREVPEDGVRQHARLGNYLRRLREGYGYTLRKVEERATALGETIDNSQLSRFEKGKAVPSFDKLRALARIFNVPVQNFSDVLDLEEFEPYKPESTDFAELMKDGAALYASGDYGRAFVTYERALEVSESLDDPVESTERTAESRWRMATALKSLGKLAMAEHELRTVLKDRLRLGPRTRMRTALQLCYLFRQLGDLYLAQILASECLGIAEEIKDEAAVAGVLNTLGNIHHAEGRPQEAIPCYERALRLLEDRGEASEHRATVLTNIGGCLAETGELDAGVRHLKHAHAMASRAGYRRSAALALTRLGEAMLIAGDVDKAKTLFAESDCAATRADECYHDILFLNAFRRWELAKQEGNPTREKISFGRLRHLRSLLQRRFPEVDTFDAYVERTRRRI